SCLLIARVIGHSRLPVPPARMIPFTPRHPTGAVNRLARMKLLVTGAAGFIGSHYVRTLLSGGYPGYEDAEVTVYDKLTYAGNLENLAPVADHRRYRFVQGDILDGDLLDEVLPGHDAVLNFAAESHVDRSIHGAADFVTTNAVGVQVLLDACLRAGRSEER